MSDKNEINQLTALVKEMRVAIDVLVKNQDQLLQQQNNNARAIGDLLKVVSNHADILHISQAAIERLWKEAGLPLDPPSLQAN